MEEFRKTVRSIVRGNVKTDQRSKTQHMKIRDILVEKTPHLSFEVFPPKTDAAYENVLNATEAIAALKPSYMSVTSVSYTHLTLPTNREV